jgi:hypothetical protein
MSHRIRLFFVASVFLSVITAVLIYGFSYYRLAMPERIIEPRHADLKPSGRIGSRFGIAGVALFCCLFLYPIRKRSKLLQRIGKTKHWLDFHVLIGISAPLFITLHSSFKVQGLAGVAYWLMVAVMLSGFIGRYFYAQIPRKLSAAALSLQELEELSAATAAELTGQRMFSATELAKLMTFPTNREVEEMSLARAVACMMWMDIQRPLRVAALRRQCMAHWTEYFRTLWGLRPSSESGLENGIELARRQSWLLAKMAFLTRTNQVFQLWHVIHRPFSYSFAVLAVVHIAVVIMMGYY